MSFLETSDLAEASSFQRRLTPCVAEVAGEVLVETPSGKDRKDQKRNDLAREALNDPSSVSTRFMWGVLSNPVISAAGLAAEDGDLKYQVVQMWSTVAGVTHAEENEQLPQ